MCLLTAGRAAAAGAALGLLLALGGCAGPVVPPPPPRGTALPDLRGTWTGTWAGEPVALLITEQAEEGPGAGGFYVGTAHVLGERRPTIAGVLTFSDRTGTTATHARGWVGLEGGRLRLLVAAAPGAGRIVLDLAVEPDGRLIGTGESDFRWGPRGPVTLTRR